MNAIYKKIAILMIVSIFVSLLQACTNFSNQTSNAPDLKQSIGADSAKDLSDESFFQLISSPDYRSFGSGNSQGYYGVFENEDGSRNILYTDYETASQVYLCEQPNCEHNVPSCTSYIAPTQANVIVAADDNSLFLITSGRKSTSYLERCELDGTNRQTICTFPAGTEIENTIAVNSRFLIVSTSQYKNEENRIKYDAALQAVEIENGSIITLYSISSQSEDAIFSNASMHFIGVSEAGCIITVSVQNEFQIDPNDIEQSFQNQSDAMIHTVYCVPWNGSSPQKLTSYQNGKCNAAFFEKWLFLLESESSGQVSLYQIDATTAEKVLLIDDFQQTFLGDTASVLEIYDFVLRGLVNNTLLINVMTNGYIDNQETIQAVYTGVCVNIETAEVYELSLVNQYHAMVVPVEVLAKYKDHLLVMAEILEKENKFGMAMLERTPGLIAIDDFLKSTPNYVLIDSIRPYP